MFCDELAGKYALNSRIHLFQRNFSQEAEPAVVDREDRNLTITKQPGSSQKGTVTTHGDRQVRLSCRPRVQRPFNVFVLEPPKQLIGNERNLRLLRLGDDNNVANIHDFLKSTKNSRFPSRPVIGDSWDAVKLRPALSPAARTFSMAVCCNRASP